MRPPGDLQAPGRALWAAIVKDFELDASEVRLLHEAARTVDELDRLSGELSVSALMATGSAGQMVEHPLLKAVRDHRATLARLIGQLGIPANEEQVGRTPASRKAQKAAQSRWSRRDDLEVKRRVARG